MCRKGSAKVLPTPERFLFSLILQTPNVQVVCPSGKKRSRPSGQLLGWHAQCISAVCAIGRVTWRAVCVVCGRASVRARTPLARTKGGPPPASRCAGGLPGDVGVLPPRTHPDRCLGAASPPRWACVGGTSSRRLRWSPLPPRHTGARPRRRCVSAPVTLGFTDPGPGAGGQAAAVPARPPTGAASRPSCRTVPYPSSEPEPPLYDSSSSRQ